MFLVLSLRKLSSCSALPPTSMVNSVSVTRDDRSELSVSVPLSFLPSSSIGRRFNSVSTPAVRVEVLYSLEDPVYEEKICEEKIVESNAQPSSADGSFLGSVCNIGAKGFSVQPSVLVPFCPQFHSSEAKINFSDRPRCMQRKEILLTGLEEQNLIVASDRNSSAGESTGNTLSSSDTIVLTNSHFAQNLSLSTCHQSCDSSNHFATFATAASLETVQCHRSTFPVWTACSAESSSNPTFFNVTARSVESSQELSTNLVNLWLGQLGKVCTIKFQCYNMSHKNQALFILAEGVSLFFNGLCHRQFFFSCSSAYYSRTYHVVSALTISS